MSKYFTKVDFSEFEPESAKPQTNKIDRFPMAENFREAIEKYHAEVNKMKKGTSDLVSHALQFPKDICFPSVVLDKFYEKPSEENLKKFLLACQQDFGNRAAQEIAQWFSEIYEPAKEMI